MLSMQTVLVICFASLTLASDSDITKFMKHLEVIPDVIETGPTDFLKITYENGILADKGVELTPTQVKNQPKIDWIPASNSSIYTLTMTDPDAPSRKKPELREWLHWVVVNIPGNKIDKGQVLTEYVGAGPPKGSGLHRYVFLLYEQQKKINFNEKKLSNTNAVGREKFSTKKFMQKYNLGAPLAGNFFQAQYDDYVPLLYKQLSA